jgi:flagellar hook protein FlgE
MLRSMMSAVTGLRSQQTAMDIIGNNIANVNTTGFKSSRATFKDMFYQTLSAGTQTTNPWQVGYGAQVGSVDKVMDRMGATQTDRPLDLYVDGDGFYAVNSQSDGSGAQYYTRVGNFHIDSQGSMVDSNGNFVDAAKDTAGTVSLGNSINLQGKNNLITLVTQTGNTIPIDSSTFQQLTNIKINQDGSISASIGDQVGTLCSNSISQTATAAVPAVPAVLAADGVTVLTPAIPAIPAGAATAFAGDYKNITNIKFDSATSTYTADYNGVPVTLTVPATQSSIKIALANFVNPDGLNEMGNSNFAASNSSGSPYYLEAGNGNSTVIRSGALEMSNVDLAGEFTNMIITERGYQSNARVVSTSDEMVQELLNMKK